MLRIEHLTTVLARNSLIHKKHLGNPVEGKLFCLGSVEIIKHP